MKTTKFFFALIAFCFTTQLATAQLATPTQWNTRGIGSGGALYAPAISPYDSNNIFMACDMSDLFHSTDFGKNWNTIPFQQFTSFHNSAVQFTDNPNVLYSLRTLNGTPYYPVKSNDGGTTWNLLASNPAVISAYKLFANPNNANQLVMSDKTKIYFSNDGGAHWGNNAAGNNSLPVFTETNNAAKGLHLAGVFFDGAIIYACINSGILVFNGSTWSALQHTTGINFTNEEIVSFAASKVGGAIKFVCVTLTPAAVFPNTDGSYEGSFKNVYQKISSQNSWINITAKMVDPQRNKPYFVAMADNDTSTYYLAGSDSLFTFSYHETQAIYKTTNGGYAWQKTKITNAMFTTNTNMTTGWWGTNSSSGMQQFNYYSCSYLTGFCVDPKNVNHLITSNLYNANATTDGGANWKQIYLDATTQHSAGTKIDSSSVYKSNGL